MVKACIFDLDGVIVDTAHYHFKAWKRLAAELGIVLTEDDNERLKGVSRLDSLQVILSLGGITKSREEMEMLADRKNDWFVEYIERMQPGEVFPGVIDLIERMRRYAMKVALASSSKNAARVVEIIGIRHLFDAIVDGTMVTHSKPDPEIFLLAARLMQVDPEACVVFEDAAAGVEAAHRAGMRCVGIGSPARLGKANKVVARTGDFRIENLTKLY